MNQENMTKIYARSDSRIQLKVIPGHFVTSQSHITHYLDLTTMKSRTAEAQNIAHELASNYEVSTPIDTIICIGSNWRVSFRRTDESRHLLSECSPDNLCNHT